MHLDVSPTYRVGVAKSKDLYAYWKEKVTQYLVEDARGSPGSESSDASAGKEFLVINVASEEVGDRTSTGGSACVFLFISAHHWCFVGETLACAMSNNLFLFL